MDDLLGAVSAYDQNSSDHSSDYFYHIFVETRDGIKIWKSLIQRLDLGQGNLTAETMNIMKK